ncbi:MAG: alpha/beta hydrolase [Caulobacter sp.]|nr:alpha/beta hydrolase [Caulobacter sp.]
MLKLAGRGMAGLALALLVTIAFGGLMSAASQPPLRGHMIDVGGRSLHMVCAGPEAGRPVVVLEAGAFGLSADWGAVQAGLAAHRIRSCAYDRAGLGRSDPGPRPRDGLAVVGDFERMLAASGEPGPYIYVGHSMAGLYARLFAGRNPDKVAGLVLIDAATPEAAELEAARRWIGGFATISRVAGWGASAGLFKPVSPWMGDRIGLPPEAARDKRRAFASGIHNRWAADEVGQWMAASRQAAELPGYDPAWPVAVVTAGPVAGREAWKAVQTAPARASRHPYIAHVAGAGHATLLGGDHADEIVKAVLFVRDAAQAMDKGKASSREDDDSGA